METIKTPQLQLVGFAKKVGGISDPSAILTYEFRIFHTLFIIFEITFDITHIDQIAQVFIMHGMRHLGFTHIILLLCSMAWNGECPSFLTDIDTSTVCALQ